MTLDVPIESRVANLELAVFGTEDQDAIAKDINAKRTEIDQAAQANAATPAKPAPKLEDLQAAIADAKNKGQQYLADLEGLGIAILLQQPDKFTVDTKGDPLVIPVGSGTLTLTGQLTVDYAP